MADRSSQPPEQHSPAPWPDDVYLRFGTLFGATVDIRLRTSNDPGRPVQSAHAQCAGCNDGHGHDQITRVRDWAQTHAAMCRGLPRPAVK
jgi:hypothetical protein